MNASRIHGQERFAAWRAGEPPGARQPGHAPFVIRAEADVAAARRTVAAAVDVLCPDQDCHGRAELVVTELATNLVRHAEPGGWMLVRPLPPSSIEMIAVDRGPGIRDLRAALDGAVERPAGLGCGLGSVRRASAVFDVVSRPGAGTVAVAVVDLCTAHRRRPGPRRWGGVSVGITEPCGDGWAVLDSGDVISVAVVDGLGHGAKASLATETALAEFTADPDLERFAARANARMRETRGAAATLCRIDTRAGELRHLSVGNVAGRVVAPRETRGLVTFSGTLGLQVEPPRARIVTMPWPDDACLVLWTDGLSSRIELAAGDDLLRHDPAVVAATLHRDHNRNRDDATVVVVRPGRADETGPADPADPADPACPAGPPGAGEGP